MKTIEIPESSGEDSHEKLRIAVRKVMSEKRSTSVECSGLPFYYSLSCLVVSHHHVELGKGILQYNKHSPTVISSCTPQLRHPFSSLVQRCRVAGSGRTKVAHARLTDYPWRLVYTLPTLTSISCIITLKSIGGLLFFQCPSRRREYKRFGAYSCLHTVLAICEMGVVQCVELIHGTVQSRSPDFPHLGKFAAPFYGPL